MKHRWDRTTPGNKLSCFRCGAVPETCKDEICTGEAQGPTEVMIEKAIWSVIQVNSNFPEQVQLRLLGADMAPLVDKLFDAIIDVMPDIRGLTLSEAADEVHTEVRWQTEQKMRGLPVQQNSIDRLVLVETILRDRAKRS